MLAAVQYRHGFSKVTYFRLSAGRVRWLERNIGIYDVGGAAADAGDGDGDGFFGAGRR